MADWVDLDDDDLGTDRIATSPTALALYENLVAAAEGKILGTTGLYGWGLSKLNQGTVTPGAVLDISMTAYTAWRHKKLVIMLQPATDGVSLDMRFSTDGGSTFDAGGGDYGVEVVVGGATTTANTSGITLSSGGLIGNAAVEGFCAEINLYNTTVATVWPTASFHGTQIDSTAGQVLRFPHGAGSRRNAQDTDAVRFLFSSGNVAAGVWTLYGFN